MVAMQTPWCLYNIVNMTDQFVGTTEYLTAMLIFIVKIVNLRIKSALVTEEGGRK